MSFKESSIHLKNNKQNKKVIKKRKLSLPKKKFLNIKKHVF